MLRQFFEILALQSGYNTSVVLLGASLLGAGAGVIGGFALLRRRALISDAIAHATLPGVALGFILAFALGGDGRQLEVLLIGALISGALGIVAVQWIESRTRLSSDAAIGTVLSVFFAAGVVLLSYIQTLPIGGQAGLNTFLLGSTATMLRGEAQLIAVAAVLLLLLVLLFFKEFATLCFDPNFAATQGWPVRRLDLLLTALLLIVVTIGLKAVGLILIIALLIIPPVAARFWTERLSRMVLIAGLFGGCSAYLGAALSALLPRLPAGAVIVLTAGAVFLFSLLFAPARGVLASAVRRASFRFALAQRQALLTLATGESARLTKRQAFFLRLRGLCDADGDPTPDGRLAMADAVRQQRLWARYMTERPEDALVTEGWGVLPIERVLPPDMIARLERPASGREGR